MEDHTSNNSTIKKDDGIKDVLDLTSAEVRRVIIASCVGTVIEWYDFYLFATLATTIASKFFDKGDSISNVIATLATSAVGFGVRPFGALLFGPIGDVLGRKYTFMLTLGIMGLATALVGALPTVSGSYSIGTGAGWLLLVMRVAQGLALGGEYGGAATYIAEHAPPGLRGMYTSFLQTTATAGLILSVIVLLTVKNAAGPEAFEDWAWRLPFLLSSVLVAISIYIRLSLEESPLFLKMKSNGNNVKNPLFKAFGSLYNVKFMTLALCGAVMGQGVVWYTSQFYSLYFMQTILKVPFNDAYLIIMFALIFATPFFIVVGKLSDTYGRKPFMMLGLFLALTTYYPIYIGMYTFRYSEVATVSKIALADIVKHDGYSPYALCFLIWLQTMYVTLVYGPIAAFLVELFPTSIRYTSMSFPYHVGNGIFGGLVPVISLTWIRDTGNIYSGLFYPFIVAGICLFIMIFFVPETYKNEIFETVEEKESGVANEKSREVM